ncbi:MAG: endopeptidase La [Pseudobdellovibrio sp.]
MLIPTGTIPILPLKNTVVYPGVTQTLRVGREKSMKAIDEATGKNNWILTLTQKHPDQSLENVDDLYDYGTLCKIESIKGHNDHGYFIVVRGVTRMKVRHFKPESDLFEAYAEQVDDLFDIDQNTEHALLMSMKQMCNEVLKLYPGNTEQAQELVNGIEDVKLLSYLAATHTEIPLKEKQVILETLSLKNRIMHLLTTLQQHKESLQIQHDIRSKLSSKLGQNQREHILREQLKTIKEELGETEETNTTDGYKTKIEQARMPKEAHDLAQQQLKKLESINPQSPEYQMIRNHLDLMVALPWSNSSSKKDFSLEHVEQVLNQDHYGLKKIKERILQHLAVMKMKKDKRGSILLFLGPPGVGKTSLGASIAKALSKKYQRISLGGVRDESEIRGHRRTYIGALPGRLIAAMKKAGQNDPVIVLDEIDKMSRGFAGDPAAAMLEVLDPEQNSTFSDHYLDTPFDLSNVLFIATANNLEGIPLPLLDRLEVIDLSGYTTPEKLHIAKNHLLPKQIQEHGLTTDQLKIDDESILKLITSYTREAGVRDLQRKFAQIARYTSEQILRGQTKIEISLMNLSTILGPERYQSEIAELSSTPGLVTGLAWTPVGGDILFIETALMPGQGQLIITGQLGDVMKESAQIAKSLIKARLNTLAPMFNFNKFDIHLHVPSGAIPKDGPSAGVTLLTSMASLVSRRAVNPKLAMTGEISLRGKVLPVGGIKEKVMAAHRAGITEILMCDKNKKDLVDVPEEIKEEMKFHFVQHINEVLTIALGLDLTQWSEDEIITLGHSDTNNVDEIKKALVN